MPSYTMPTRLRRYKNAFQAFLSGISINLLSVGIISKRKNGLAVQMLTGAKHRRREAPAVHGVGEQLCFQTHRAVGAHPLAALARLLCQRVGGIELHSRQIGFHRQTNAAPVAGQERRVRAGEDIVVVVAAETAELDMAGADLRANLLFCPEIKGCSFDAQQFSCRQSALIVLAEPLGVDLQPMLQRASTAV